MVSVPALSLLIRQHVTVTTNSVINASDLDLGRIEGTGYHQGKIDNTRFYDYVRTPAQIAWDYNRGKPIAHWRLDECQGTIAYDSSGVGNTGTIVIGGSGSQTSAGTCATASTAWGVGSTGKYSSSLNFDGTDDYITHTPISSLSTNFSVSTWIKWATGATGADAIYQSGSATNYWRMGIDSGNKFNFTEDSIADYPSNKTISQNVWHHVVITKSGDSGTNLTFYVNGKQEGTASVGTVITPSGTAYLSVKEGTSSHFDGQIDDVKIFNYALTSDQIKVLYNDGAVSFR